MDIFKHFYPSSFGLMLWAKTLKSMLHEWFVSIAIKTKFKKKNRISQRNFSRSFEWFNINVGLTTSSLFLLHHTFTATASLYHELLVVHSKMNMKPITNFDVCY